MKKLFFAALALTFFVACNKKEETKEVASETEVVAEGTNSEAQAPTPETETATSTAEVVNTTLTDKDGKKLVLAFDNAKNTLDITLEDGTKATLKGEETGSGIKYANEEYTYDEWQGETHLKKNGKEIFTSVEAK